MSGFQGFDRKMPEFLFALRFNNNIDNQAVNIEQYRKLITEPLRSLYEALLPTVDKLECSLETRPARCISSPYTDRRFSPDVPLKEYMYIRFRRTDRDDNVPGLYFDMGADDYSYGLRIYKQTARGMSILRDRITDEPDRYTSALSDIRAKGYTLTGRSYKTDHCPSLPDSMAKELCNMQDFYISKTQRINDNVFSDKLSSELSDGFNDMGQLLNLF